MVASDPSRFASVLAPEDRASFASLISSSSEVLRGRVIWNVNSTQRGGGVAELLQSLLGYVRGSGVDARWVVIRGDPAFFATTKKLHNHLHGFDGDGDVDGVDRKIYERTLAASAAELIPLVRPDDVVILHDPQTAGLVEAVRRTGATVIWRCHVGLDAVNERARQAWGFLLPYVESADAYVFSRSSFAWEGLDRARIHVIPPSIDPFSVKNQDQTPSQSQAILSRAGIIVDHPSGYPVFTRADGSPGRVDRRADVLEASRLSCSDRVIAQISRWDRLKDPVGVLRAFSESIAARSDVHLLLGGPSVTEVADDPDGAVELAAVEDAWAALPTPVRRRVHLASLPLVDVEENAAIVNALQRHATVVVQKSLAEGFGLTVAEAMWKARPVVASRTGGIQDQIVDGVSGILIDDPTDLGVFADCITALLLDPARAAELGNAAHITVRDHFLSSHNLTRYFELIQHLATAYAV